MKIRANRRRVYLEYREMRGNSTTGWQRSGVRYGVEPVSYFCDQCSGVTAMSGDVLP